MFLDKKINVRIREDYEERIKKIRTLCSEYKNDSDFYRASIFRFMIIKEKELGIYKEPVITSKDGLSHKDEVVI
jgi:hypothetical protein